MTWPTVKLSEVCEIERNGVEASQIASGTTYVGLENIERSGKFSNVATVQNGELASTKFRFSARHVLYGKLRPYLSKIALPDFEGVCSTDILPILSGEKIHRNFVFHFLRLPEMVELANSRSSGANLPRLSPKVLAEFEIPLPPLDEQKRLAAILDRADELRRMRLQVLAGLDELAQSLFLELFGDFMNDEKSLVVLGEIAEKVVVSYVGPTSKFFCDDGIPFLRTGNVGVRRIIQENLNHITQEFHQTQKKSILKSDDIVISRVISDKINCAIIPPSLDGANCGNIIIVRPGVQLSSQYFVYLLSSPAAQRTLLNLKVGSAQSVVNTTVLKKWKIPLPPIALQQQFAQQIEELEAIKVRAHASLTELDALFAALQARAFAGELSGAA